MRTHAEICSDVHGILILHGYGLANFSLETLYRIYDRHIMSPCKRAYKGSTPRSIISDRPKCMALMLLLFVSVL